MKVKLLECVAIDGRPTLAGEIVDIPSQDAASLIRRRMAEHADEGEPPKEDVIFDTAEPEAPEPKSRRK